MADLSEQIFDRVVKDADAPGGLDKKAQEAEPGNFLRHVAALSSSKLADGFINPKLVLSWLLAHLGAGAFWVGLLVPVRESLALLPQVLIAPRIAAQPVRKWFWAGGAAVQGFAAGGIALAALTLEGTIAGAVMVGLLAVLALARSVCSASYKDVLGKTVGTSRRGTTTGSASTVASVGVIVFALLLMFSGDTRFWLVVAAVGLAAGLWGLAAVVFSTIREEEGDTSQADTSLGLTALTGDAQLRRFIVARSLLVGTALAPPYLVMLNSGGALSALGALLLASALATLVSSFVWGRLSDRSSRRVLIYSGLAGAAVLALIAALPLVGWQEVPGVLPVLLFGLMIAYEGVRQGRSTHLIDMADEEDRARYTAVSNSVVGKVLIVAGAAAAAVASLNVPLVIALFAVMCLGGAAVAARLNEVQDR